MHSRQTFAPLGRRGSDIYVLIGQREHSGEMCQTSLAAVFFLTSARVEIFSIILPLLADYSIAKLCGSVLIGSLLLRAMLGNGATCLPREAIEIPEVFIQ
jgi:hypothetical protein